MSDINWGIIGCGDVTEVKSGPAFNKVEGSNLVAVMRRDAAKAADYAQRHSVGKWYSDAEEMMDTAGINAVYIATPPDSHLPYAISALKKGLHVYVEKPVTLNAGEARQMADAVKQGNAKLTVAHYRRGLPLFLKIKELIDNKTVGEIRTVQIRLWQSRKPKLIAKTETNWRVNPEISGGGYFHDLAPHQLDLMLFYFGEPDRYRGYSLNQAGTTEADDHVCGHIVFKNNIVVNGSWCFNVAEDQQTDTCEIIGTEGSITFAFFGNYVSWKNRQEEQTETFVHPQHIEQPMITKVVAYLNNQQYNPCAIEEAVTLMDIMDSFTKK
ncbi:Gfo/Idh/MocA family oxidoreductase [Mucilaginibacter gynuensis]|uniref:Gfo/Idh/MocA family oxidoreductase n=1 Tax=Mucilaginibacter gynuensis TaxID=1302236 RepID=A0ABP8FYQ8_9SPHI